MPLLDRWAKQIALEVGIAKAKELAKKYNKPLIAVNHIEGHAT